MRSYCSYSLLYGFTVCAPLVLGRYVGTLCSCITFICSVSILDVVNRTMAMTPTQRAELSKRLFFFTAGVLVGMLIVVGVIIVGISK